MVFKDFSEHDATKIVAHRGVSDGVYARYGKRTLDLFISLLILPVLVVVIGLAAIAIKLTSRGPVFFKQTRHGKNMSTFKLLKLRSMPVMEDGAAFQQAVKNDVRVTPVGRFLRRTSLDELPQILNVLRGEMSLIGPRPHAVKHDAEFSAKISTYNIRFQVKPGVTGLAQMRGYRGPTDTDDAMRLRVQSDIEYVRSVSAIGDVKILLGTALSVLGHKNAF